MQSQTGKGRTGAYVARCGRNRDKTRDGTRAETDCGPLALETVVPEHPGQTADAGSEVGDDASLGGTEVGAERGSAIEAEPSEPEEDRAENDVGRVVGLVRKALGTVATALAEVDGNRERGGTGADVHGRATGEVKTSQLVGPTVRVPSPACDRVCRWS